MGQATADVNELDSVEREVEALRLRTQALVAELEERVGERVERAKERLARVRYAADLPARAREHPAAAAGVGAGALVAIGVGVYLVVERRRRARRPLARLRRQARAYRALVAHPERALGARTPSLRRRLIETVVTTLAGILVRQLAMQVSQPRPRQLAAPVPIT
jgi:hypothetical protein